MGNTQSTTAPREQNRLTKPRTNVSKNPSSTQLSVVTVFGKTISNPQPCSSTVFETSPTELSLAQQLHEDERGAHHGYQDQFQASAYHSSLRKDSLQYDPNEIPKPADFDSKLYSPAPYGSRTITIASLHRSKRLSSTFTNSSRLSLGMSTRYPAIEDVGGQPDKLEFEVPAENETISSKQICNLDLLFLFRANEVQS